MSRVQKDTVEYFPHDADASAGDTLTVLEGQYANDGYVFWFKLLERLASTEGHFIDCNNLKKWQLLLSRARVDENTGVEMMKLLVVMGAIDKQLWEQDKIIWCQHLVDNVAEVYANRRRELPRKPISTGRKLLTTPEYPLALADPTNTVRRCPVCGESLEGMRADAKFCSDKCRVQGSRTPEIVTDNVTDKNLSTKDNAITTPQNLLTTPQSTQSKVKESKEEETKEESLVKFLKSIEQVIFAYQENILLGGTVPEDIENELKISCRRYSPDWVYDAIKESLAQNHPHWGYIGGILRRWSKYGKKAG